MNNLDPDVAERPDDLVVYGGSGKAARNWEAFDAIVRALKADRAVARAREVVAVEILCACQAIDLLAPLTTSPALARAHALVRSRVPTLDRDRAPSPDIAAIVELLETGALETSCAGLVK